MRPVRFLGPAILIGGFVILAVAVARGEASLYLVVLFPVVVGSGFLGFFGMLLVFAGFALTFLLSPAIAQRRPPAVSASVAPSTSEHAPVSRRWGGVLFLGPIPIVFGSDSRLTRAMLLIGMVLFLVLLALTLFVRFA